MRQINDFFHRKIQLPDGGTYLLRILLLYEILSDLIGHLHPERALIQAFERGSHHPVLELLGSDSLSQLRLDQVPCIQLRDCGNRPGRFPMSTHVCSSSRMLPPSRRFPTRFPQLWKSATFLDLYPGEISDARFVQHGKSAPTTVLTADLSIAQNDFRASKTLHSLSSLFSIDYSHLHEPGGALKHFGDRPFAFVLKRYKNTNCAAIHRG